MLHLEPLNNGGFRVRVPVRGDSWLANLPFPDSKTGESNTPPPLVLSHPLGGLMMAAAIGLTFVLVVDPCWGSGRPSCHTMMDLHSGEVVGRIMALFLLYGVPLIGELEWRTQRARNQLGELDLQVSPLGVVGLVDGEVVFESPLKDARIGVEEDTLVLVRKSDQHVLTLRTASSALALQQIVKRFAEYRT